MQQFDLTLMNETRQMLELASSLTIDLNLLDLLSVNYQNLALNMTEMAANLQIDSNITSVLDKLT